MARTAESVKNNSKKGKPTISIQRQLMLHAIATKRIAPVKVTKTRAKKTRTAGAAVKKHNKKEKEKQIRALEETTEYQAIPPNFPMRPHVPKYNKRYVPVKERLAALTPRSLPSRLRATPKNTSENTLANTSNNLAENKEEMDVKLSGALSNAIKSSNGDMGKFRCKLYHILARVKLQFDPVVIASILLEMSAQVPVGHCIIDWVNGKEERMITLLKGLFLRVHGLKDAVNDHLSKNLDQIIPLENATRLQSLVNFYVLGLQDDGFIIPAKSIWGHDGKWSPNIGFFIAQVLERMESSIPYQGLYNLIVRNNLAEMIASGSNFIWQLEGYLPSPRGLQIKNLITRTCERMILQQLSDTLKDNSVLDPGKVMRYAKNCGFETEKMISLIWKAILKNTAGGRNREHHSIMFLNQGKNLGNRGDLKEFVLQHGDAFLDTVNLPAKLAHLSDSIMPFISTCISSGVLNPASISGWNKFNENREDFNNALN